MCLDKDMISAYCDGETSGKVKSLIEAHLNECAECRRIAETYRFVSQAVRRCGEEPDAAKVRAFADEMETKVSAKDWPFPTYGEILFSV